MKGGGSQRGTTTRVADTCVRTRVNRVIIRIYCQVDVFVNYSVIYRFYSINMIHHFIPYGFIGFHGDFRDLLLSR